jgi:hypothetical protein
MVMCPNVGFPARSPSKTARRATGWERDGGVVEEIGKKRSDSSSNTI